MGSADQKVSKLMGKRNSPTIYGVFQIDGDASSQVAGIGEHSSHGGRQLKLENAKADIAFQDVAQVEKRPVAEPKAPSFGCRGIGRSDLGIRSSDLVGWWIPPSKGSVAEVFEMYIVFAQLLELFNCGQENWMCRPLWPQFTPQLYRESFAGCGALEKI